MAMKNILVLVVLLAVTAAVQSQLEVVTISGYVSCSFSTPNAYAPCDNPFRNANVTLQCSTLEITTITNQLGYFSFNNLDFSAIGVGVVRDITQYVTTTCTLTVKTPLSQCDAAITETRYLQSTSIIPVGFLAFAPSSFALPSYN